jgi:WD40 repeat protein
VNSISFNPESQYLFATASSDQTAKIWDLRNNKKALYTLVSHHGDVFQVDWSPCHNSVLATSSADRLYIITFFFLVNKYILV